MAPVTVTSEDLALALELAEVADGVTAERFRAGDLTVHTKPDRTPVTEADTGAEQAIRRHLAAARAGDAVLGEEFGADGAGGVGRRWIVDPIDGTQNYLRGVPVWATLLALEVDGAITVAAVSAPALGRRWWAARGQGAYTWDALTAATKRLSVSGVGELADGHLSFAGLEDWPPGERRDALLALVGQVGRTRSFGDFWAYMLVAEGSLDLAIDPVASLWDLAAMQLIVEEAGGRFTDLSGARTADGGDALATNGLLHDAALAAVGRPAAGPRP